MERVIKTYIDKLGACWRLHEDGEITVVSTLKILMNIIKELYEEEVFFNESATGGYVLGFSDENGRIWYGGISPSSYINPIDEDRIFYIYRVNYAEVRGGAYVLSTSACCNKRIPTEVLEGLGIKKEV